MEFLGLDGALRRLARRFRKPDPKRLAWEQPLRARLLRRLLVLAAAAEILFLVLAYADLVQSRFFPWIGIEALLLLLISIWLLQQEKVAVAATLLVISLSHAAAFVMAASGAGGAAPALLLPTIIIAGLVIGGYFLAAWTAICALLFLWISATTSSIAWPASLFWCGLYATTAYLIWLFSFHLENLLAASRRAEEDRHEAVVEERTRLAREVHDTLAQGFTGIVVQINAAEQIAAEKNADVWGHLEKARALARQSLEEARRSILALRSGGPEQMDLLQAIERTARQLLVDDAVQFEVVREGPAFHLPDAIERELLRVGQEAVTNAIRHSGARKIRVAVAYLSDRVQLCVSDDGRGVSPGARGLGMQGMEERMRRIHGEFKIVASNGAGTTVTATAMI